MNTLNIIADWLFTHVNPSNIESFCIAVFGIGITIFTVLYSFIVTKRDYRRSIWENIQNGKGTIEENAQYIIAGRDIERHKQANVYAIIISALEPYSCS